MIALGNWLQSLSPVWFEGLANSNLTIMGFGVCFRGPRFEGDRPRFGDRDGYRGPRGGDAAGEKGGAPADYQPSFQVNLSHSSSLPSLLKKPMRSFLQDFV